MPLTENLSQNMLIPCIISGGAGSRLWPVSRETLPKPFIRLADDESLLQKTFLRASMLEGVTEILTVTNRDVFFRTMDDYRPINRETKRSLSFILEPFGRNTAPAIAAAALQVRQEYGPEALLLVLPADQLVGDPGTFKIRAEEACRLAADGWLVTFGIHPNRAETGFGYIQRGETISATGYKVFRFVEKPDVDTARQYVESGLYSWNAGMFCFRVDTLIEELQQHAPDVLESVHHCLETSKQATGEHYRYRELDETRFEQTPNISIDYALMERSNRVAVIPCDFGWTDIGSWRALSELMPPDENGNRQSGAGETVLHDVKNCHFQSDHRLIGAVGVHDLIVVDTPDALLIAGKEHSQEVRALTAELKKRGHDAYKTHRTVNRPWGAYSVLEEGPRFKIKRILVRPGSSLSLQMHYHRSEHWIVVSGMAQVNNGEREFLLNTNESTFIPAGRIHRLSNPGTIDLVIIEVQSGDYLGEDDIVRFEDVYGRQNKAIESDPCVVP